MNKEYIDREKVVELIDDWFENPDLFAEALKFIPSADVAPVVLGLWIVRFGSYPYCSNCGKEPKGGHMTTYCPNCGARMDPFGAVAGEKERDVT